MRRAGGGLSLLSAAIAVCFLLLPLFVLLARGLSSHVPAGLDDHALPQALALSLLTTALSMVLIVTFGTPLAWMLARRQFPLRRFLAVLLQLPLVLPPAVAGLALLLTLGRRGFLGPVLDALGLDIAFTATAVILAQTFVAAPFFLRAAQAGFASVPPEIEAAARVDGAQGLQLFLRITLPLSLRALGAGLTLAWARALGEFGATILFAGSLQGRTQTMPLLIYNALERNLDTAIQTGVILVLLALAVLALANRLRTPDSSSYI